MLNIFGPDDSEWAVGVTLKIKNITSMGTLTGGYFYPANNPGDGWDGSGTPILPGQEVIHTVIAAEFKAFLNAYNQGVNTQTFEITIL